MPLRLYAVTMTDPNWLRTAFIGVQDELTIKLKNAAQSIAHPTTQGNVTEQHWLEVLRSYLPDRYEVASAIVVDSTGARSEQIDVVIFDRYYTPVLLGREQSRYIPAEAVYAVFEVKPHFDKAHVEYAGRKAQSVRRLHRTSAPIAHAGGEHPPKMLFTIVAGLLTLRADWSDGLGEAFRGCLPVGDQLLACGCALEHGSFDTFNGSVEVVSKEGALIYFLFRLLSKLQTLGTVPAIDWTVYAGVINRQDVC